MKNIYLLIKFIKGTIILYLFAILAVSLAAVFQSAIPIVIRIAIDSIIGDVPLDLPDWLDALFIKAGGKEYFRGRFWILGILIIILTAFQSLFFFLRGKLASVASENSGRKARESLYNHILNLPYKYHVKVKTGDLIQRCTSDVETIQNFIANQLIEAGAVLLSFTYVLLIMLSLDVAYALISISIFPVIVVFTLRFFINMKKQFKKVDEAESVMTSVLQENLTGVRVVKAFAAQDFELEKFDTTNVDYKNHISGIIKLMSNFWSASDFLSLLQIVLVLLTGIYLIVNGRITLGTFLAFSTYVGMLLWPIRQLGHIFAFAGQAFVSLNRIQKIFDEPEEKTVPGELKPNIQGNIEISNVCFEYEKNAPVLEDISINITKGQTIAVLGATGSGKSSLAHLLVRLYDCQKGIIRIDGVDIKNIDRKWIRENIGIVLQDSFLFSKTIKDNIRLGNPGCSENDVYKACHIASVHHTINKFKNGYDTFLGERGVTLSGGQKQRVAIARAVIKNVPILIFDDSLSAVDIETDAQIRTALKIRSKDTTTIIISHRIATISQADMIYVIENGRINQSGTHQELINEEGLYKRIWEIQNEVIV